MIKEHLESVLQREMSRKEFLSLIGYGAAAIIGLTELARVFSGRKYHGQGINYSAGTYGGGDPLRH